MYIIAGSFDRFTLFGDMYSMDFASLLDTGNVEGLHWKKHNLKGPKATLARWGHSSCVFEDRIYIYGGRAKEEI